MPETATLDELDSGIIQCLQADPRVSFSRAGAVLGVSEQTVARRYRRLHGAGLVRVVGMVDPQHFGQTEWTIRVGCRPGGVRALAEALARRDDVSWVTLSAAGSEIVCSVRSRSAAQRDELLLQRLPATSQVLSMTAHALLHRYVGGASGDWSGYADGRRLTPDQLAALAPRPPGGPAPVAALRPELPEAHGPESAAPDLAPVGPADLPVLDELGRDGRASHADLAAATGWSQGRVARRVEALYRSGVLYYDVELATELLGFATSAYLWLTVEPAALAAAGEAVGDHPEVPFAAAVTGSANLLASVVCRDSEDLYRYVTGRISVVPGVRQLEVVPMLRRLKAAGSRLDGRRLAVPAPPARARRPARRAADPGRTSAASATAPPRAPS
jgi:DNA-binding Lrp family transcriptional regulator